MNLSEEVKSKLLSVAHTLIDQNSARVIVEPQARSTGFWFGGGNMVMDESGNLLLVGRYRNVGDSRTGLGSGQRGLELAIFQSSDGGETFEKVLSFDKAALSTESSRVLSIEGSALHMSNEGVTLFVSTEKADRNYPPQYAGFQKPGTGVWSIDVIQAENIAGLASAPVKPLLACDDPRWLHVKDPFVFENGNDDVMLGFVTHSFSWSSANAGYVIRRKGESAFSNPVYDYFPRGFCWDVAISRMTAYMQIPSVGIMADVPPCTLAFYDGGESMRDLDEHRAAANRPRGYSCEELGGVAVANANGLSGFTRLSRDLPAFVSPNGSGCSRYVDILETAEGYFATWQQSQMDGSQPLVMNFVSKEQVVRDLQHL